MSKIQIQKKKKKSNLSPAASQPTTTRITQLCEPCRRDRDDRHARRALWRSVGRLRCVDRLRGVYRLRGVNRLRCVDRRRLSGVNRLRGRALSHCRWLPGTLPGTLPRALLATLAPVAIVRRQRQRGAHGVPGLAIGAEGHALPDSPRRHGTVAMWGGAYSQHTKHTSNVAISILSIISLYGYESQKGCGKKIEHREPRVSKFRIE
jgi:hypothetical protein